VGKISRREILKTGTLGLVGASLGFNLLSPGEVNAVPAGSPGDDATVLQIDVIPPLSLPGVKQPLRAPDLYTLVLQTGKAGSQVAVNRHGELYASTLQAVRSFRSSFSRDRIIAVLLEHHSVLEECSDWDEVADRLLLAVNKAEERWKRAIVEAMRDLSEALIDFTRSSCREESRLAKLISVVETSDIELAS